MNNYEKYLATKPEDFITTRDIAKRYSLSIRMVQQYARILEIKKDSGAIYVFNQDDIQKLEKFLEVIKR